ncbi:MAG: hypothetical protein RL654_637 [Pseudomonadota bacterium]|jgi:hypothetical protein
MTAPFHTVASALEQRGRVRFFGSNQLRAACPVCGGRNTNTFSAKAGETGAVLVKCWKSDCTPEQVARALGLEIADLFPPREREPGKPASAPRRVGMLPPMQALELIAAETFLVLVAAENLANGFTLTDTDRERLRAAAARIQYLTDETRR